MPVESTCGDLLKVRNPLTNKCILIRGKLCQTLLKDPSVKFDKPDLQKIKNAGYHVVATQQVVPVSTPEETDITNDTTSFVALVKKHIKKFLEKGTLQSQPLTYLDNNHKKFCESSSSKIELDIPTEKFSIQYSIPIDFAVITKKEASTFIPHLSNPNVLMERVPSQVFTIYFNNYNQRSALTIFNNDFEIPYTWLQKMNIYVKSLPTDDKFTVLGYSYHSFDFINSYLRGTLTHNKLKGLLERHETNQEYFFPFFIQVFRLLPKLNITDQTVLSKKIPIDGTNKTLSEWLKYIKGKDKSKSYPILLKIQKYFPYLFWKDVMEEFKKDLKRIIDKSPPVTTQFTIYRGVKDDYFLKGKNKHYYKNNTFVSCSLNPFHSVKYVPNTCCLKRITILPGSKALLMAGLSHYKELEVILNVDSVFYIHEKRKISIYKKPENALDDLCFNSKKYPKRKIDIVDIVVSPNPSLT